MSQMKEREQTPEREVEEEKMEKEKPEEGEAEAGMEDVEEEESKNYLRAETPDRGMRRTKSTSDYEERDQKLTVGHTLKSQLVPTSACYTL